MLVLGVEEPELAFFDTEDQYDAWLASMLNDVDSVGASPAEAAWERTAKALCRLSCACRILIKTRNRIS
jgi:hypothetical protein